MSNKKNIVTTPYGKFIVRSEKFVYYCIRGEAEDILRVYFTFEKLYTKGVITENNSWMGNIVKSLGKNVDDFACDSDFRFMWIRDYDEEPFVRLYLDTYGYEISIDIVEELIEAAGVSGKVTLAYCAECGEDIFYYYPSDAESYLFIEPDEDALLSTINSYWIGDTPATEVAENFFGGREFSSDEELEAYLMQLRPQEDERAFIHTPSSAL